MLIGRAAETATIERVLADAREGRSGVVVVRGEAGVGKSALLRHAVERGDGFTVLRGVGVEVESELAYAALHQILRPVFGRIDHLPEPQAAALRAAFALSSETVDERFRVSLGVLGLISEVADGAPLLIVVDDAQWLDQASADALVFVARRLEAESVALLFAARDDHEHPFVAPGLPELRVSSLGPVDARALVAERLGSSVVSGVVEWVVESANGNPLALVELPANLTSAQLHGHDPISGKLPPATSVEQVYLERVEKLPPSVRMLLLVAAAEETGARAVIQRAGETLGLDVGDLAAAESAGLLRVDGGQLEFRHPLVRSAVYRGVGFADRERAHAALAAVLDAPADADRRAWHRSAATVGTDEEVADELERTADRAAMRSGWAASAAALQRAAELPAHPDSRARRLVGAAESAWHGGQPDLARALVASAVPTVTDPLLRAKLDHLRGIIELRCGSILDAGPILVAAARSVAELDLRKAMEMLFDATAAGALVGDYARIAEAIQLATELTRRAGEYETFLAELLVGVGNLMGARRAREVAAVRAAVARAGELEEPRWVTWGAIGAGVVGDDAGGVALLRRAAALARASGSIPLLSIVLQVTAEEGIMAGRHTGEAEAAEGLSLAQDAGLRNSTSLFLATLAWFAGVRGEDGECRARAAEAVAQARVAASAMANAIAEWGVALLDLGAGRPEETITRLDALRAGPPGIGQPYVTLLSAPDLVEACVRSGRHEQARIAFEVLERFAQPGAPTWTRALAARCRALLVQHAGDADPGEEFLEALRLHAANNRPFDRARTELLYGEYLRRERRRTDAREQLRAALEAFEQLRAEPWAERARGELRATGETARKRDPSTIDQLTPQELQIARLVAEGNSNKEVAAQLFLSPRTVEYHLRKVFAKVGIASRTELIRLGIGHAEAAVAAGVA